MLPRAVAEGRRIARNIHRLGRLYVTKTVYAGFLILFAAIFGCAFPFLPRQLTVAAHADDRDPVVRARPRAERGPALPRPAAARAGRLRGARRGSGSPSARCSRFFIVDKIFGGSLAEGRTAATTTLIVLGLCFILLLERGPGREHITIQSYMLAMVAGLGALLRAGPRGRRRCASSSTSSCSRPASGSCACSRWRPGWCSPRSPGGCPTSRRSRRPPRRRRADGPAPEVAPAAPDDPAAHARRGPQTGPKADRDGGRAHADALRVRRLRPPPHEDRRHDRPRHPLGRDAWRS